MVKVLNKTPFHFIMVIKNGKNHQLNKLIEELNELSLALKSEDIESIKDELADVELTLPYLKQIISCPSKFKIDNKGKLNYQFASAILQGLIRMKVEEKNQNFYLHSAIDAMAVYICNSLACIYIDYDIDPEEIEEIKRGKMKRSIMR